MAKPAPLFPQRIEACNTLRCTRIVDDVAVLATGLGTLRVPLSWWRAHQHQPSLILVVSGIDTAPQHIGATAAKEKK
jgi:hypothetical protein